MAFIFLWLPVICDSELWVKQMSEHIHCFAWTAQPFTLHICEVLSQFTSDRTYIPALIHPEHSPMGIGNQRVIGVQSEILYIKKLHSLFNIDRALGLKGRGIRCMDSNWNFDNHQGYPDNQFNFKHCPNFSKF